MRTDTCLGKVVYCKNTDQSDFNFCFSTLHVPQKSALWKIGGDGLKINVTSWKL